ncbi:MAG TPA: helix-turn-helix domain-containing protein [Thermomicrobiaceae bacterium]|nr:helix-turn-helix domain-containing protein [Thermomicrobiaceae bacterium]
MMNVDGIEYLSAPEAAALLGVKITTLYAYASRGRVRSYRRGIKRERLYRRAEIEALLELRPSGEAAGQSLPGAER